MRSRRFAVTMAFVAAQSMNILDSSVLNVALPSIDRDFHASASSGGLLVVSYLTMLVVVMPISGWLGDRFGTRRVYLTALITFTLASAACGLAQNLPELVAARVIQGIGGGALLPSGMTMLYRVYSPSERVKIARVITIPTSLAPLFGPPLGGFLSQELSWRWVFWVNLPIGFTVLLVSLFLLKEERETVKRTRVDVVGFVLSALGIGALVYGITEGANAGWGSLQIDICLAAGIVLTSALVVYELRVAEPLLKLSLIKLVNYRRSLAITLLAGGAFSGVLFVVPLMLQLGEGRSPLQSGLSTLGEALGVVAAAQVVSRVHERFGERQLQALGFALLTALITLLAVRGRNMSLWEIRCTMFGIGIGSGTVQLLNQAMAFNGLDKSDTSQASALFNTSRRLGAAIAVALLSSMLATSHTSAGVESGFSAAFVAAAGLTGLGLIVAVRSWRSGDRLDRHRPDEVAPAGAEVRARGPGMQQPT